MHFNAMSIACTRNFIMYGSLLITINVGFSDMWIAANVCNDALFEYDMHAMCIQVLARICCKEIVQNDLSSV